MTTETAPASLTARDLLGPDHDGVAAVRKWLGTRSGHEPGRDPLFHLSHATRAQVIRQIADAIDLELGGIDIGGLLVKGWSSYTELRRAGEATANDPHTSQILQLASHSMDWSSRLAVTVAVDHVPLSPLDVVIDLHVTVEALVAVVKGGRLVAVRSGRGDATVTITVGPGQATSDPVPFNLERLTTIALGRGIPLVDGLPDGTAPPTPTPPTPMTPSTPSSPPTAPRPPRPTV